MASSLLFTPLAAHAEGGAFILRIQQLEVDQARPFYLTCLDAKNVCRGRIALTLDGAQWPVFVKAVYALGRVIIAFADESNTFAVGSENFAVIPLNGPDVTETTVNLSEPLAQLSKDSPWLGYHRPVFRQSDRIIAKIQVDVWTAH